MSQSERVEEPVVDGLLELVVLDRMVHERRARGAEGGGRPGPERGDYFKKLRSVLSSRALEFIVHRVLSGKKVTIEDIAHRFRNLTLARLCKILNDLR